jgi:propanol-preferring alcohol dehydrogenase
MAISTPNRANNGAPQTSAGIPKGLPQCVQDFVRKPGRLLIHGEWVEATTVPPDNYVKLPIFETVLRGINIKGSIVGTHRDVEDVFTLHALGRMQVLRETRPLEEVNEAFDDVLHARNKAPRVVLTV